MQPRFNQITTFLEVVKPKIIAEAGAFDPEITDFYISNALKHNQRLTYFGLAQSQYLPAIESKLKQLQKANPLLNYFLINLEQEIDLEETYSFFNASNELEFITIPSTEFAFINNVNDVEDFEVCVRMFGNTDCILMDRYIDTNEGALLKTACNGLLPKIKHQVLPIVDAVYENSELINVQLVLTGLIADKVRINNQTSNTQQPKDPNQVQIKTKNALPNEEIQRHVEENVAMLREYGASEVLPCVIHDSIAYMVGGAPSYKKPENMRILRDANKIPGHYIFTSKTAHDYLIEQDIVPFGCILLDPRHHVPDFVTNPHPRVRYFVASQCNPKALENLIKKNAKVYLYHAAVGAGEQDVLKRLECKGAYVAGGSTSMTRGIGMLHIMGFHNFKLFGIDSSYSSKPERVHGINQEKQAMEVEMSDHKTGAKIGQKFWTDAEFIAQCNDIENMMKNWLHLNIENYSEGMVENVFSHLQKHRRKFEDFIK